MFAEVCPIEDERAHGNFMNEYDKQSSYTHTSLKEFCQSEKSQPTLKISELYNKYAKEKETGGNWGPKTKIDNNAYAKTIIEIIGDIDVSQIDNQLMLEYRDILIQLPPNREKSPKYRGTSIPEILKVSNIKPMSIKTVNCHLSFASSLQKWGVQHGFLERNFAESLTFKRNSKPSDERKPYDTKDLLLILDCISTLNRKVRPERFWTPIISLYSGLRLTEICQLYKEDIRKIDDIWCLDINKNDAKKRVKTKGSIRIVPIHPIIIELGFLEYVNEIKSRHLWPNLKYNEKNGYGNLFQKWFQRINRNKITKEEQKTFHSLRHNLINNLKQNGFEVQLIAEIVGHSTGSITMERYGKSYKPKRMLDALNTVDYKFDIIAELEKRNSL